MRTGACTTWSTSATSARFSNGAAWPAIRPTTAVSRPADGPQTWIRTEYLELDPAAYLASTDRGVTVERARDRLTARAMRFYLKQDRLQLDTDVQGRFTR